MYCNKIFFNFQTFTEFNPLKFVRFSKADIFILNKFIFQTLISLELKPFRPWFYLCCKKKLIVYKVHLLWVRLYQETPRQGALPPKTPVWTTMSCGRQRVNRLCSNLCVKPGQSIKLFFSFFSWFIRLIWSRYVLFYGTITPK